MLVVIAENELSNCWNCQDAFDFEKKKSDTLKVTPVTRMNEIVCTRVKLAQSQTRIAWMTTELAAPLHILAPNMS